MSEDFFGDPFLVDHGPVGAAQVPEDKLAPPLDHLGMPPRDFRVPQANVIFTVATKFDQRQIEIKTLALIFTPQHKQRRQSHAFQELVGSKTVSPSRCGIQYYDRCGGRSQAIGGPQTRKLAGLSVLLAFPVPNPGNFFAAADV